MKKVLTLTMAVLMSFLFTNCGGSSNNNNPPPPPPPPTPVSISLTESAVTLTTSNPDYNVTNTHTFQATVRNATNSAVTWKVNGIVGGDTMTGHGIISASGVYTAPTFIPPDAITVSATSVEDPTKSASATVSLDWYVDNVYVTTSGNVSQVKTGEQLPINGVVTTAGPQTVTWDINGVKVGSPTLGALMYLQSWPNTAFYTAPPAVPSVPIVVRATSDANPAKSASIQISVLNSDASEPRITISPAEVTLELGKTQQFTVTATNADGSQWVRPEGISKLANGFISDSGLYTAPYEMPSPTDIVLSAWASGYSNKYAYSIVHVAPPSVNPNTRVNGNYVIALHDAAYAINVLGVLTADGNGNLHGTADLNTSFGVGTGQEFSGTYSLGSDGRGQASITYNPVPGVTSTLTARLMMHSNNLAHLYGNDPYLGMFTGMLEKQTASSFSQGVLNGGYAFLFRGQVPVPNLNPPPPNTTSSSATAGFVSADGNGNITGSSDTSGNGILTTQSISGTYTLQNSGRGTASLNFASNAQPFSSHWSIAVVSPEKFYVLSTDDLSVAGATSPLLAGTAELQSGAPFTNASLSGSYAGYDNSMTWMQLLRFDSNGAGTITNGVTDERDTSGSGAPSVSTNIPFLGSYFVDPNGHGQIGIRAFNGNGNAFIYMVSPSKFFMLLNEPTGPAAGEAYTQSRSAQSLDWSELSGRYAVDLRGSFYDGVGWILPYYPTSWMGWVDYSPNIKTEPSFDFNMADSYGTGQMFIGFNNGMGISPMRYHAVSNSRVLMMSMFPGNESNVLVFMNKLEE